ncbi:MAG: FtsL-like putative cell division protein [Flavobacteriales bacterium]
MSDEKKIEEKAKAAPKKGLSKRINEEKAYAILPFVIFLTLVAVVYIANSYYVEHTIRDIARLQTELHELRAEDIELKTIVNIQTRQSEVIKNAEHLGLKPLVEQPAGILIKEKVKPQTDN